MTPLSHAASVRIGVAAETALAFLADPAAMHRWSFGTWETILHADGLVEGRSLFDGAVTFARAEVDAAGGVIRWHLGPAPDRLTPRIVAHVVPGERLGFAEPSCVLTFLAWRAAGMDDERWHKLTSSHETELVLIKALLERPRPPSPGGGASS